MDEEINRKIMRSNFSSPEELKEHIRLVQAMVSEYEKKMYETYNYDDKCRTKIREWRNKLYQMAHENKITQESSDNIDELEKTARLVHRQIGKADTNQSVLDKSTLKLMGLNYTSKDIENALVETKEKMKKNRKQERAEVFLLTGAFVLFVCVCILILFDKLVSKT
ncbi:hypothetical protein CWI42_121740 [Ordospora colligata]|uniref:Sec20 C-terminal domain-containing protein n=1 Tax=Ordospora colligata OC4 TaxID=1354746 RepID=A0A0B2UD09_9MICR|nr:uncharacterized protein M896_121740 [Ordospora colligata OC4]KHN68951.1 hypothetical protein M896_121740 [Ordospora colligata OC4]TBU13985.1 hypothetical protein CWI40_121740 [Ordospora colligata]TBU14174.1 hypothetical protein CWI41_121740 [Ordospora colligata]TBU17843.1 hypothetical protein CWI42_121740 [Ordospora colligata]